MFFTVHPSGKRVPGITSVSVFKFRLSRVGASGRRLAILATSPERATAISPPKVTPFSFHGRRVTSRSLPFNHSRPSFFPVAFNSLSRRRATRKFLHSPRRKNERAPPGIEGGRGGAARIHEGWRQGSEKTEVRSSGARNNAGALCLLDNLSFLSPVLVILRLRLFVSRAVANERATSFCVEHFSRASRSRRAGTRAEVNASVLKTYCDIIYSREPRKRKEGKKRRTYISNDIPQIGFNIRIPLLIFGKFILLFV